MKILLIVALFIVSLPFGIVALKKHDDGMRT